MSTLARRDFFVTRPQFGGGGRRLTSWASGALDRGARGAYGFLRGRGVSTAHISAGADAVRAGAEGTLVGGILGYVHATHGLDVKKVPVDAAAGVLALIASVQVHGEEGANDLRNVGSQALGIFAFRSSYGWAAQAQIAKGKVPAGSFGKSRIAGETFYEDPSSMQPHGDFGAEDPIIAAARAL
jgi:hypothetical protein